MSTKRAQTPDKSEILLVAAELFGERGYRSVSVDEIARAVGISKPTFYAYATSKAQLISDIVDDWITTADTALEEALAAPSPLEQVRILILNWTVMGARRGGGMRLIDQGERELPSPQRERYHEWMRASFEQVRSIIDEGQRSGVFRTDVDLTVATFLVTGVINWTARWFRANARLSAETIAEQYWRVVRDGLWDDGSRLESLSSRTAPVRRPRPASRSRP